MESQSDGGDGRNRTVGIVAGARLCRVYTIGLDMRRQNSVEKLSIYTSLSLDTELAISLIS
jgi:hypothetical protein